MADYKGSVSNLPPVRRFIILTLGVVIPPIMILATILLALISRWWPVMLVPDLIVLIVGLSVWGTILKGSRLDFKEDGMEYRKGFQKGFIRYGDIIKVYQVSISERNSTFIVFRDKDGSQPRCFSVEQTFSHGDKVGILKELISRVEKGHYDIVDNAPLSLIKREKDQIGWVNL
ncbi:MAG: hypothetical protein R6V01_10615 [Thermoplasmatota archaeon]